jgi:5-methylcytosine-specific restriction endonuclease McrA
MKGDTMGDFSPQVKSAALFLAANQCQCIRSSCPGHPGRRCASTSSNASLEPHHKVPAKAGGSDTLENCEILCKDCHKHRHQEMEALQM